MSLSPTYSKTTTIPKTAIDENGHVNNVAYVQWMHAESDCRGALRVHWRDESHAACVRNVGVREHRIEYLLPAFAGEEIEIKTQVEDVRRVRSLRKYEFPRKSDGKVLVKGETDWVFVDVKTGAPRAIPQEVSRVFALKHEK